MYVSPEFFGRILSAVNLIVDESLRANLLVAITPRLTKTLLYDALGLVRTISDPNNRANALAVVATHLQSDQKWEILREAINCVKSIVDEHSRASTLSLRAPQLSAVLLGDALTVAKTIGDEFKRAITLSALLPHLTPEKKELGLNEAMAAAKAVDNRFWQSIALTDIAPSLPAAQCSQVYLEALAAVNAIRRQPQSVLAQAALAPRLPDELKQKVLSEALTETLTLAGKADRQILAPVVAALGPHLPPSMRTTAFAAASKLDLARRTALGALAPYMSIEALNDDLILDQIDDAQFKITIRLAGTSRPLLPTMILDTINIKDPSLRFIAFLALIPHLPSTSIADAISIAVTDGISDRGGALFALAPYITPNTIDQYLSRAVHVFDHSQRVGLLTAVVSCLTKERREQVLIEELARLVDDIAQSEVISAARDNLQKDFVRWRKIQEVAPAIAMLAYHLPDSDSQKAVKLALSFASEVSNDFWCSIAVVILSLSAPIELRRTLFGQVLSQVPLDDLTHRVDDLGRSLASFVRNDHEASLMAEFLRKTSSAVSYQNLYTEPYMADRHSNETGTFIELIDRAAHSTRGNVLSWAAMSLNCTMEAAGKIGISLLWRGIQDVTEWYP
jgi:hypothetical protein